MNLSNTKGRTMHPDETEQAESVEQEVSRFRDECAKRADVCQQRAAILRAESERRSHEAHMLELEADAANSAVARIDQQPAQSPEMPTAVPAVFAEPANAPYFAAKGY